LWVIATLAGLAVLIILVLSVPLDAALHVDIYGRPKFRLRLEWLFGLVSKELRKRKKEPEEKKVIAKKKRGRIKAGTIFQILKTKGLIRQIKKLLSDVLGQLKIREFIANFKVGLDNPADTGLLFALIGPATPFLSSSAHYQIRVQPSFYDGAVFEGYLHGALRLRPIQLVIPFLRFVFSLAILKVVKTLILSKWKRKK